jgi:hypothetical protein
LQIFSLGFSAARSPQKAPLFWALAPSRKLYQVVPFDHLPSRRFCHLFQNKLASSSHPADDVSAYGFVFGVISSTVGFGIFAVVLFGAWIWIYASNVPKLLPFGFSFPQGLHRPRRPPFKQVLFSHFRFRVCFAMAIFLSLFSGVRAPLAPESAAEDARARQRSSIHLAAGRVLRAQTMQNRGRLIEQFQTWLFSEHGISWNDIFGKKPLDPEECFLGW